MSDASIVYVTGRTLTMSAPGIGVYHWPDRRGYCERTYCGRVIWTSDQRPSRFVPLRVDIASGFARVCEFCEAYGEGEE